MAALCTSKSQFDETARGGQLLIAVGLAGVLVGTYWATVPIVTAVSLLILGATRATVARYRRSPAFTGMLLLHSATYAALYTLFLGAALHNATTTTSAIPLPISLDLVASVVPVVLAAKHIAAAIRQLPSHRRT